MDTTWVFDTPVTSPIKSPKRSPAQPDDWPDLVDLAETSAEVEEAIDKRSGEAGEADSLSLATHWQLFSTTLIVLVVAATAALATNRVSEILFVALSAYLLVRGVMSSLVSNILAPGGSGSFGFVARRFVALRVEYAERRIQYGILFIFSPLYAYSHLEYEQTPV